jgi:hypothetical protein
VSTPGLWPRGLELSRRGSAPGGAAERHGLGVLRRGSQRRTPRHSGPVATDGSGSDAYRYCPIYHLCTPGGADLFVLLNHVNLQSFAGATRTGERFEVRIRERPARRLISSWRSSAWAGPFRRRVLLGELSEGVSSDVDCVSALPRVQWDRGGSIVGVNPQGSWRPLAGPSLDLRSEPVQSAICSAGTVAPPNGWFCRSSVWSRTRSQLWSTDACGSSTSEPLRGESPGSRPGHLCERHS